MKTSHFARRNWPGRSALVSRSRIGWAFAAMDLRFRRGVSDEHTLQGSVRSEQRSLNRKDMPPGGLRRSWLLASLLLSHSPTSGMLLRRASPEANCGATNAHPIREWDTSPRELDLKPGTRGHGCPRSNLPPWAQRRADSRIRSSRRKEALFHWFSSK